MKIVVNKDGSIKLPLKARQLFSDYIAFYIKDGYIAIRSARSTDKWKEVYDDAGIIGY